MRHIIFLTISLFYINHLSAQDSSSIKLIRYKQYPCESDSRYFYRRFNDRVVSEENKGDTLFLLLAFGHPCCADYVPRVRFIKDTLYSYQDTLNIDIKNMANDCFCTCYYRYELVITGLIDYKSIVRFDNQLLKLSTEKYKTYPVQYKIINGDTINVMDRYGVQQGLWTETGHSFQYYIDGYAHKWGHLYPNGKIRDESDGTIHREYSIDGKLEKEETKK